MDSRFLSYLLIACLAIAPLLSGSLLSILLMDIAYAEFEPGIRAKFPSVEMDSYQNEMQKYLFGLRATLPEGIEYNNREIKHMADVRSVVLGVSFALLFIIAIIAILCFAAYRRLGTSALLLRSLFLGGISSLALTLFILFSFALFFETSFVFFHSLFFEDGTWIFYPTDMLILLYPAAFFEKIFVQAAVICVLLSLLLALAGFYLKRCQKDL